MGKYLIFYHPECEFSIKFIKYCIHHIINTRNLKLLETILIVDITQNPKLMDIKMPTPTIRFNNKRYSGSMIYAWFNSIIYTDKELSGAMALRELKNITI